MYQKLIIAGYLGADPELRFTPAGKAVANFSMATSAGKDDTTWWRVTVWEDDAERCAKYLHKGSSVLVEGRVQHDGRGDPRTFERKDGTSGSKFEVTAHTVRFLSKGDTTEEVAF